MKNKIHFGIVAVLFGSLCFAGIALAQYGGGETAKAPAPDMPKEGSAGTQKGIMGMGNTTKPAATSTPKAGATAISAADKAFMTKAANGNLMEVQWGKWAGQSAQNADVKSFGNKMVTDHTKLYNELIDLAQKKGVQLKAEKVKGKWTSDKDYMDMMVKDHQGDWAEFQAEAKSGTDPDLKKWSADSSKVIKTHLDLAKKTQSKLK